MTSLVTLLFCGLSSQAQDYLDYPDNPAWRFRLNFGFGLWESQQNLDPVGIGDFDAGPAVFEIGADFRLAEWGNLDLYLGLDGGLMTTESDIPGQFTSPTSDASYLAPSLALYVGEFAAPRLNLRAGAGRYTVEFSEWIDTTSLNRTFRESTFGAFAGVGLDLPLQIGSGLNSISLDSRVHFVDFGEVERLGPNNGHLEGPIWTIQLGWARRF
jgi:hypothetical protein